MDKKGLVARKKDLVERSGALYSEDEKEVSKGILEVISPFLRKRMSSIEKLTLLIELHRLQSITKSTHHVVTGRQWDDFGIEEGQKKGDLDFSNELAKRIKESNLGRKEDET